LLLHFQFSPWDLLTVIGYVFAATTLVVTLGGGNLAAVLLAVLVPGYTLVAALFPEDSDIDWTERILLSAGLSLVVVPLLVLSLNFTPWGIGLSSVLATIDLFSVGMAAIAWRRRQVLPVKRRLSLALTMTPPALTSYGPLEKMFIMGIASSLVTAGVVLAFVALAPGPGETFTEFYVLGSDGNASGYPTTLNVSQAGSVLLEIVNHEAASVNYTVRVDLVGVVATYNATTGGNETMDVNQTTWSWYNVTLDNGQDWKQRYTFQIDYAGLWKVRFVLSKSRDISSIYRELHLFIRVT